MLENEQSHDLIFKRSNLMKILADKSMEKIKEHAEFYTISLMNFSLNPENS